MLKRGDEITLEISNAGFEGKSIGRHDGLVVFVEGGVPGDIIRTVIVKIKKGYVEARLLNVLNPSPLRVQPRCKYFGVCGGCKWQHVDYQAQLRFKQQHVIDAFERIGCFKELDLLPILGSDEIFYYRGKMEYSFSDQQWSVIPVFESSERTTLEKPQVYLGLHVPRRYDKVLDIDECHLQSQLSNRVLNTTRDFSRQNNLAVYNSANDTGYLRFLVIRESKKTKEIMVNLVTYVDDPDLMQRYTTHLVRQCSEITTVVNTINSRKAQIAFGETEKVYYGNGFIHEQMGEDRFTVSASSFFQTNVAQAERLYCVIKEIGAFKSTDVVFDLYSGTGSIAISLAKGVGIVVGIESVESAIRDAEKNTQINGITNCRFVLGDLKDRLTKDTKWMSEYPKPDALVIDPPRSGMHPRVVDEILSLAPERIVYVSCNPATQARDVKLLCDDKYKLVKLQPVDMFPHTYHIENVVLLQRR